MAVLYRKYRPQTFEDVAGQKFIIQTLKNQIAAGQVGHAYLFTGSRGVGKTTIARILAKAVNCKGESKSANQLISKSGEQTGDACGECEVCHQIEQGNFLDLIEIDAASNTGVENIRDLIEHVKFSPSIGKYKVFIIDEVHMLSKGAFNALLKTLEEPPKHAIFVLATTEIHKVPATIISRTQRFDFKRLDTQTLFEQLEKVLKLEKVSLNKDIVSLIAQNAEGSARDALSLLDKVLTLGNDATLEQCESLLGITDIAISQKLLDLIISGKQSAVPTFLDALLDRGIDFDVFNRDFLEYLRKILIYKVTAGNNDLHLEAGHLKILADQVSLLSTVDVIFFIRLFLKSYKDLGSSPSPQIPFLLSALEAAARKKTAGPVLGPSVEVKSKTEETSPVMTKVNEQSIPEEASTGVDLNNEDLRGNWGKVINKLKLLNASLANLLKNGELQGSEQGRIIVVVKFAFHKQNLEQTKNYTMICGVLKEVFGQPVGIKVVVAKDVAAMAVAPEQVLADALKVFGGELID